jgi:hypothetical protein
MGQGSPSKPEISQEGALNMQCGVDKQSLTLLPATDPAEAYLNLTYSSNVECVLKVTFFCKELVNPLTKFRTFETDLSVFPGPIQIRLPAGLHEPIPATAIPISLSANEELMTSRKNEEIIPALIELFPVKKVIPQAEISYLRFTHEESVWKPKLIKQFFYIKSRYFRLSELYGVEPGEEERTECVVCMMDRKNVVLLPCRHACLCWNCANIMARDSESKCPICREMVDNYMRLGGESETT